MTAGDRQMKPLARQQALDKLATAAFGRVIFTEHAMPALRQVNHLLDNKQIIIRSHPGSAITGRAEDPGRGSVVLYQADDIDPRTRTGWTVTVTGLARLIGDAVQAARYKELLHPWVAGEMDTVISIDTTFIEGFELTEYRPDPGGSMPSAPAVRGRCHAEPRLRLHRPHLRNRKCSTTQRWKPPTRSHPL